MATVPRIVFPAIVPENIASSVPATIVTEAVNCTAPDASTDPLEICELPSAPWMLPRSWSPNS